MENTKVKIIVSRMEYFRNLKKSGIPGPRNEKEDEFIIHLDSTFYSPTFLPQQSHISYSLD